MEIDQHEVSSIGIGLFDAGKFKHSPGCFFEAGAYLRCLTKPTYVSPYLLDLEPNDVKGPSSVPKWPKRQKRTKKNW